MVIHELVRVRFAILSLVQLVFGTNSLQRGPCEVIAFGLLPIGFRWSLIPMGRFPFGFSHCTLPRLSAFSVTSEGSLLPRVAYSPISACQSLTEPGIFTPPQSRARFCPSEEHPLLAVQSSFVMDKDSCSSRKSRVACDHRNCSYLLIVSVIKNIIFFDVEFVTSFRTSLT